MRVADRFISRVVGGWNVRLMRNGERHGKFFADARFGGKTKAMQQARLYRDELVAIRQSRAKAPAAKPLLVTRGTAQYLQIRIPRPGGGTKTTEFSISRHGPRKAKQLAIEAYKAAQTARA